MIHPRFLSVVLLVAGSVFFLEACSSTPHDDRSTVTSSGTPVNPFADPGGANQPSAPLTGSQPQVR